MTLTRCVSCRHMLALYNGSQCAECKGKPRFASSVLS